ncbi:MAG: RuBisCO large subunit C-terminal-like domain-containing protein [Candidatus Bathyarchaeia archaeon]
MEFEDSLYASFEGLDPDRFIFALYYIETNGLLSRAAEEIAVSQSTGTWVPLKYETEEVKRYRARIVRLERHRGSDREGYAEIAYPVDNVNPRVGGIPELLVTVAGCAFEPADFTALRLIDVRVPRSFAREFPGPRFGIEGLRRLIGGDAWSRPLIGTPVKPCVGLTPDVVAEICYEAAMGGIDFIKDDELNVSPKYCPIEERVPKVMEALDRAKEETGKRVLYAPCITTRVDEIVGLAEKVVEWGANALFLNVVSTSFSAVQAVAEDPSVRVPIHVHKGIADAWTRNPSFGIDFQVLCKLARLSGGDSMHVGGVGGGYIRVEPYEILKSCRALRGPYHGFKPTLPGIGGGIHPGNLKAAMDLLGNDIIFLVGGGIHGHPDGPRAGVKALRQAIDAHLAGTPIEEKARQHPELARAIERWGLR